MTTLLQQRVRASGTITPSLWIGGAIVPNDSFDVEVAKLLDGHDGLSLRSDFCSSTVSSFRELLSKSITTSSLPTQVLVRRRSILLGIMANTPKWNGALVQILKSGFLSYVRTWLNEAMNGTVGGTDFLLHLLSSVTFLPVTKELIAESKMGKTIAQAEKSKVITASPNSSRLREKIAILKSEWTKSVKANKKLSPSDKSSQVKRKVSKEGMSSKDASTAAKKQKPSEKKGLSTSDLLRKSCATSTKLQQISRPDPADNLSAAEKARRKAKEKKEKKGARLSVNDSSNVSVPSTLPDSKPVEVVAKPKKKVRFAEEPIILNANDTGVMHRDKWKVHDNAWKDMKKKEHLNEKELLESTKKKQMESHKSKLASMSPIMAQWKVKNAINNAIAGQAISAEVPIQNARIPTVTPVNYNTSSDIPLNPTGFQELETDLNNRIQPASNPIVIPFFIPQSADLKVPPPAQVVVPTPASTAPGLAPQPHTAFNAGSLPSLKHQNASPEPIVATLQYLQQAGLPLFLVGSNIKALQTIISSPGLLQTFLNPAGQYDEARLKNLVQNLSPPTKSATSSSQMQLSGTPSPFTVHSGPPAVQTNSATSQFFNPPPPPPLQAPASAASFVAFGVPSSMRGPAPLQAQFAKGGFRGDQNTTEGNLHVSGYGPGTTQNEIYTLFSHYMRITELVPKGTFCFVNSNDPAGARRARESLNGTLVGGSTIKINFAVRKERDPTKVRGGKSGSLDFQSSPPNSQPGVMIPGAGANFGSGSTTGHGHMEQEVDDRGNIATKNLFVAGYGQGTSEHEIRQLFNQFGVVTGTVMKNTYAFVNMSNKENAIVARRTLMGKTYNGGTLRVNFAKESGRLGTSFDQTYNSSSFGSTVFHHHNV